MPLRVCSTGEQPRGWQARGCAAAWPQRSGFCEEDGLKAGGRDGGVLGFRKRGCCRLRGFGKRCARCQETAQQGRGDAALRGCCVQPRACCSAAAAGTVGGCRCSLQGRIRGLSGIAGDALLDVECGRGEKQAVGRSARAEARCRRGGTRR